jgi:hypothetical protein
VAGRIYVNTFGENDSKVFSTRENYHYQIMQSLTERGYAKVQGSVLKDEEKWMGLEGGFIVHVSLTKGGKAVFFMTRDEVTADRVAEALKLSVPGIALHPATPVDAPE